MAGAPVEIHCHTLVTMIPLVKLVKMVTMIPLVTLVMILMVTLFRRGKKKRKLGRITSHHHRADRIRNLVTQLLVFYLFLSECFFASYLFVRILFPFFFFQNTIFPFFSSEYLFSIFFIRILMITSSWSPKQKKTCSGVEQDTYSSEPGSFRWSSNLKSIHQTSGFQNKTKLALKHGPGKCHCS